MPDLNAIQEAFQQCLVGLGSNQQLWLSVAGEHSDFVRFNHGSIRQAGEVDQCTGSLSLIKGPCQAAFSLTLAGDTDELHRRLEHAKKYLLGMIDHIPEDPYLFLDDKPRVQISGDADQVVSAHEAIAGVREAAADLDVVGIWASGSMVRGLLSSLGHQLWHHASNWSFDWSVYSSGDKAVKCTRGGATWQQQDVADAMAEAKALLPILQRPAKVLEPGAYRTWFAPRAVAELLGMLNWGGFSTRAQRTNTSVLQRVLTGERAFSGQLRLSNCPGIGGSPLFGASGHALPKRVALVADGGCVDSLTGPRSAAEYDLPINAAGEYVTDLVCDPGDVKDADVLQRLGKGVHVADCWYTNWSDRNEARVTGMTRFHSFWVENGEIHAPLAVMRFDDSLLRGFGENLEALGERVEVAPSVGSYGSRDLGHTATPGALLSEWKYPL